MSEELFEMNMQDKIGDLIFDHKSKEINQEKIKEQIESIMEEVAEKIILEGCDFLDVGMDVDGYFEDFMEGLKK